MLVYLRVHTRISNCNVGLSGSTSGKNSGHVEPTRMGGFSVAKLSGETHQNVCGCGEKQIRGSRKGANSNISNSMISIVSTCES